MSKIARLETFLVAPRWLFVRLETDDGIVGWGEASCEGHSETVAAAIEDMRLMIIGADADRIEDLWRVLSLSGFYRFGPILSSAVSGVDHAMWDIKGKRHGVPVHELLGGRVRDKLRVYCWVGGDDPSEIKEQISARMEQGLTAIKMNGSGRMSGLASKAEQDGLLDRMAAAREVLGDERDMAVDFHGRISYPTAKRLLKLVEPLRPFFIEEPVVPENTHLIPRLIDATSVPIATGERLYNRQEFLPVLQGGISVVQPDLSHAGGITEVRKIATMAESYGALLAPHCPLGPLALAASIQVDLCTSNFVIQEGSFGIHYNTTADVTDYIVDKSIFDFHADGYLPALTAPGLGVEIDEKAVRDAAKNWENWKTPIWRYPDGSLSEW